VSQVVVIEAPVLVNAPPVTPAVVTTVESRVVVEAASGSCTVAVQDVQALVVAELGAVAVLAGREAVAVVEVARQGPEGQAGAAGNLSPVGEVPTGTIDGTNAAFNLSYVPQLLILLKNGLVQRPGVSEDFTLVGQTVVFNAGSPVR
jgi:hypothetical protein